MIPEGIEIIRVLHGSRDIEKQFADGTPEITGDEDTEAE